MRLPYTTSCGTGAKDSRRTTIRQPRSSLGRRLFHRPGKMAHGRLRTDPRFTRNLGGRRQHYGDAIVDLDAVPHWRNYWSSKALTKGIPRTARRLKPGKAAPEARLEVAWIATLPDSPASRRTHGRRLSEQRLDNEAGAGFAPSGELRAEAEALQWRSRTWTARQSGLLRSTTWWWPRHWSRFEHDADCRCELCRALAAAG